VFLVGSVLLIFLVFCVVFFGGSVLLIFGHHQKTQHRKLKR
jgi:hypothetical protein